MHHFDAFGQRIICRPLRLRYITTEEQALADAAAATAAAAFLTENGFPQNTVVADMPVEQQAAYWRHEAKKQQKKTEGIDLAKLRKDSEDLEKLRKDGLNDQQKAVEDAREEARREGENIGAERYLKDAVMARFQTLTGKTDDEVDTAFAHVDPKSFRDDSGAIDVEKLKSFAAVFGTSDSGKHQQDDPVAAALARQTAAGGGSGTSIAEKRKQTRESMTKTNA